MNFGCPFRVLKAFAFAALFIGFLTSRPPAFAAPSGTETISRVVLDGFQPVLSDFDRDRKIDRATLLHSGSRKTIHISYGRTSWAVLSFESNTFDRGALVSSDIDHDGDTDLVWISSNADQFIAWLSDGFGNFSTSWKVEGDASQLESIWWNSSPSSVQPGSQPSPTALLTRTNGNLCDLLRCDPKLVPQILQPHSTRSSATSFHGTLLQLRGPPSLPFDE